MKAWDSGRVQNKMLNKLERQEKQQAFLQEKFFKFKFREIHNTLSQALLMKKIIETDNPAAISEAILLGMKKALRSTEFDFKYFISPLRDITPRANPYSLYMTQYILEVIINDPDVIEVFGTDLDIYNVVNEVIGKSRLQFERAEEQALAQLANNKSLVLGSRDYEIALDQLLREKTEGAFMVENASGK